MTLPTIRLTLLIALLWPALTGASDDPRLLEARNIAAGFMVALKSELTTAIAEGGPAAAIAACKVAAPRIASELSSKTGATVSRTSLRVRNPANAAKPWQSEVLLQFESAKTSGDAGPFEYFGQAGESQRYMRAILTAGLCLACHGTELSPAVEVALEERYPTDQARGYQLGDIRGAISIVWQD